VPCCTLSNGPDIGVPSLVYAGCSPSFHKSCVMQRYFWSWLGRLDLAPVDWSDDRFAVHKADGSISSD